MSDSASYSSRYFATLQQDQRRSVRLKADLAKEKLYGIQRILLHRLGPMHSIHGPLGDALEAVGKLQDALRDVS